MRGNEGTNFLAIGVSEIQSLNLENAKPFEAMHSELKIWTGHAHNALGKDI